MKICRRRRAKKVRRFVSSDITAVHDAYGAGGELGYEKPISHDTELLLSAILKNRAEQLALQQEVLASIDEQKQLLREQTNLLEQIQHKQSGG